MYIRLVADLYIDIDNESARADIVDTETRGEAEKLVVFVYDIS